MKCTKSIQAIFIVPIFVIVFLSSCCVGMPMMYPPHYNYRPMYKPHIIMVTWEEVIRIMVEGEWVEV